MDGVQKVGVGDSFSVKLKVKIREGLHINLQESEIDRKY